MIDAVLPVVERDFDRVERLLLPSITHHLGCLGTCWIVVPNRSVAEARARFTHRQVSVVDEYDIVPELRMIDRLGRATVLGRLPWHPHHRPGMAALGWYKQQLVKLSAGVTVVETNHYLTLDADVLATRPVTDGELVRDGRSALQRGAPTTHRRWYVSTGRALGLEPPPFHMDVTPALLATDAVSEFADWIGGRWRWRLIQRLPWTEYAAYITFLEAHKRVEEFHFDGLIHWNALWGSMDFESWDVAKVLSPNADAPFTLVQSNKNISVERVVSRVAPHVTWV